MKVRLNKQYKLNSIRKKNKYTKKNTINNKMKSSRKKRFLRRNNKSIKKINRKLKGGSCQPKIIYHPKSNPSGGINNYNIIDGTTQVSMPVFPTYDMYVGSGIQYSKF